jgi:hypothetical protein
LCDGGARGYRDAGVVSYETVGYRHEEQALKQAGV